MQWFYTPAPITSLLKKTIVKRIVVVVEGTGLIVVHVSASSLAMHPLIKVIDIQQFNLLSKVNYSTVEPHYYSHLRAKHFWLLYRGGCFTEVQMYWVTSFGTWLGGYNNEVAA